MIKSYGPFEPLLLPGATRPPPHRVSIPQPLYGNRHPETHLNLDRDSTIGSKVMARSNRYSCLARPDLSHRVSIRHPLYGKGHPKTRVKFRSRSNGRIKSYCLYKPLFQSGATRCPPHRVSIPHPVYGKGHPESPVKFRSRSNGRIKSYCLYEPLLQAVVTRPPPHRVSIPHPLYGKRTSGNSSKILIPMQRSDQQLWRVRTVTLAWRDQTSSSPSIDSTTTIWKGASGNSSKFGSRSNDRIKSYGPFEPLLLPGATRPPAHRVSIPHPLHGKRPPKTKVKF